MSHVLKSIGVFQIRGTNSPSPLASTNVKDQSLVLAASKIKKYSEIMIDG